MVSEILLSKTLAISKNTTNLTQSKYRDSQFLKMSKRNILKSRKNKVGRSIANNCATYFMEPNWFDLGINCPTCKKSEFKQFPCSCSMEKLVTGKCDCTYIIVCPCCDWKEIAYHPYFCAINCKNCQYKIYNTKHHCKDKEICNFPYDSMQLSVITDRLDRAIKKTINAQ